LLKTSRKSSKRACCCRKFAAAGLVASFFKVRCENCMDGAFGGHWNTGEPAHEAFPDFASTPAGVLTLHVQDVVLHLEGELIRVPKGTSAPVRQPFHPTFLVAIENLVTGLAGNPELSAKFRHWLAGWPASHKLRLSSITEHSFHGITPSPKRGKV
jgi:hypothetical protein